MTWDDTAWIDDMVRTIIARYTQFGKLRYERALGEEMSVWRIDYEITGEDLGIHTGNSDLKFYHLKVHANNFHDGPVRVTIAAGMVREIPGITTPSQVDSLPLTVEEVKIAPASKGSDVCGKAVELFDRHVEMLRTRAFLNMVETACQQT